MLAVLACDGGGVVRADGDAVGAFWSRGAGGRRASRRRTGEAPFRRSFKSMRWARRDGCEPAGPRARPGAGGLRQGGRGSMVLVPGGRLWSGIGPAG
jgi:hypothetical protein